MNRKQATINDVMDIPFQIKCVLINANNTFDVTITTITILQFIDNFKTQYSSN